MANHHLNGEATTPSPQPTSDKLPSTSAREYESQHVHEVYEKIASHFSSTRYKPWPLITSFLLSLPAGSIGLDLGCGNGKYLSINPEVYIIGSDRSANLASIAREKREIERGGNDVIVGDILSPPHPQRKFDFVISIAVIHHLSTSERRIAAVREILSCLRPDGGRALIYVWALEQKNSRRGWDEDSEQDQLVPWVMKGSSTSAVSSTNKSFASLEPSTTTNTSKTTSPSLSANNKDTSETTYNRYYHLYRRGELELNVRTAGGIVLESGWERDNWWVIATLG